jgi:hypothetical protein
MGMALAGMEKQYGSAWPDVQKDLVRAGMAPAYQALAQMNMPGQEAGRSDLTRALQEKATLKEGFGKAIDTPNRQALEAQVIANLQPLAKVMTAYGSNAPLESVIGPAVHDLATHYATQGMAGSDAADKAYGAVMGKYDIGGRGSILMVPKTYEGQPLGIDKVIAAGANVTANLKDEDLKGTTAAEARSGYWVRSGDGTGALLMKKQAQGNYLPVRRNDGGLVSMPFSEVAGHAGPPMLGAAETGGMIQ